MLRVRQGSPVENIFFLHSSHAHIYPEFTLIKECQKSDRKGGFLLVKNNVGYFATRFIINPFPYVLLWRYRRFHENKSSPSNFHKEKGYLD